MHPFISLLVLTFCLGASGETLPDWPKPMGPGPSDTRDYPNVSTPVSNTTTPTVLDETTPVGEGLSPRTTPSAAKGTSRGPKPSQAWLAILAHEENIGVAEASGALDAKTADGLRERLEMIKKRFGLKENEDVARLSSRRKARLKKELAAEARRLEKRQ